MEIILPVALILSNLYNYIFPVTYYNNINVNTSYVSRRRNRLEGTATIILYNRQHLFSILYELTQSTVITRLQLVPG
jgi:hypothetical protein